jgi:transcriptional regulator with XRE-family HTH domain
MPENSNLLKQLANRCKLFHSQTGISQTQVAKAVGMSDGNYSAFLSGRKGIGSEATCLLLKYTALSPQQAVAAFSKPVFSASVVHLQERGRHLHFNNPGRVAREGATDDPNGTTDITTTSDAQRQAVDNLLAVLAELDEMARVAVLGSIAKAYPNPLGITPHNGQRFSRKR